MNLDKYIEQYGEDLFTQQLDLENKYKRIGEEALRASYEKVTYEEGCEAAATKLGQSFLSHEFAYVSEQMHTWLTNILKPKRGTKPTYVNLLEDMVSIFKTTQQVAEVLTLSALSTMFSASLRKDNHNSNMARHIGAELEHETSLQGFFNENPKKIPTISKGVNQRVRALYKQAYLSAFYQRAGYKPLKWDEADRTQLAATIIHIITEAGSYFEKMNADKDLKIVPTRKLTEAWSANVDALVSRAFTFCPTIIPPKKWESFSEGGYHGVLTTKTHLLRFFNSNSIFRKEYLRRLDEIDLSTVLNAVNSIQETPWKVNKDVLNVAQHIIEQGGGRAGIPLMQEATPPAVLSLKPSESEIQKYKKIMVAYYRSETRRNSIRLRTLASLRTASEFAKYERFYVPHNMDFRGRIYPIPTFNFQGDDLTKGLLLFADTPKLASNDPSFIRLLCIEGANRAGVDKVSFDDRVKWVEEHEQEILEAAEDPIGSHFWEDQDCPFQFLNFCLEYKHMKDYQAAHGGSIEGFQTGIVISFDGTCSGLQHFSAALRDPVGGQAVNLLPTDKPSDIYRIVADKVNKQVSQDCLNGTEDETAKDKEGNTYRKLGTKSLGLIWNTYGVTRKVTKRSVMTLAYGSKEYGFTEQLMEDIIKPDVDAKGDASLFKDHKKQCAKYLAKIIWNAVQTTVVKAVEGMKWLQQCASIIASEGKVVTWVTPAGLPVQQHYMEKSVKTLQLRCAGKRIRLYIPETKGNVDKAHQRSGIAPNFIHSLDAAHLQLTTETCMNHGLRHFAMVHDSYGTCLAHASIMFRVVREEFVRMYEENDVLKNIADDLQELTTTSLPPLPIKASLDLQQVLGSDYIFC